MAVGGVPNPLATMRRVQSKPAASDRTPYQIEVRKWMESDPRGFTMDLAKLEREWKETLAKRKAARRAGRGEVVAQATSSVPAALPAPDENAARALALCRSLLAKMSARRGEAAGGQGDPPGVPPL